MPATVTELATRTLQRQGVLVVASADRPAMTATRTVALMAADALRAAGVNLVAPLGAEAGTITAASAATQVLRRLGVVDALETPATADQARAEVVVGNVHGNLVGLGLANWASSAIPTAAVEPYILMTAAMLALEFGKPQDLAQYEAGQAALRRMQFSGARGQAIADQKVREAHARLVAAGIADWPADSTPDAYAADTVEMAALLLAPIMGNKADQTALQAAEARARRGMLAGPRGLALAEQAVRDVHVNLASRALTRWLLVDIPAYAEEPYAMMAAYLLAPRVGERPNPDDWAGGERQILRAIMLPTSGEPIRAEFF